MGDVCGCEAADGGLRDGGVDEELVFGERFGEGLVGRALGGVEDASRAYSEGFLELYNE